MLAFYFMIFLLSPALATIIVHQGNLTVEQISDMPALFGPPIPFEGGMEGLVVKIDPPTGCSVPIPPPKHVGYSGDFIAIVRRYNCSFVDKVLNAQKAGYKGVIVRNVDSNSMEIMSGGKNGSYVMIPSVFIGEGDGVLIEANYLYLSGFGIIIFDDMPFDVKDYLLPFAITIGICFVLLLSIMVVKCIREYRLTRRHRLSSSNLRKIPIHKFKKGDPYECCAVCLEDYIDNDKLRVLPCGHAYHTKCIDPWLTKNRRVCPVCKRKVLVGNEKPSDLDSDTDDETAPLLNTGPERSVGGTFRSQSENPFVIAEAQASRYNRLREEEEDVSEVEEHPQASVEASSEAVIDIEATEVEILSNKSHRSEYSNNSDPISGTNV